MKVKIKSQEFETCPALGIMFCNLLSFCDNYNLPFDVVEVDEECFVFSTLGWTSQLAYKYQYCANRDYSDLGKIQTPVCILDEENSRMIITVSKTVNTNKYSKE